MRLIDADEVKNYILTEGFYCDTQADREDTAKEIDLLFPTIKAIPIEWIDNWGRRNTFFYGDKYNVITILLREWDCKQKVILANKRLEDWEKENEKDI